jgi:hypothetical protein
MLAVWAPEAAQRTTVFVESPQSSMDFDAGRGDGRARE